jgi:ORF6N domain
MSKAIVSIDRIARTIYVLRGQKVILDSDLAALYGVPTGHLNRAVKRNAERFPVDFMFQLSAQEVRSLKCQFGISKPGRGGGRYRPYAFTEEGVAMLSSVLRSLRAIRQLVAPPEKPRREIGFHVREKAARCRSRNGR